MTLGQINDETLAGTPKPEAETASAILAAGDGGYVAVSFPISAYSDEATVQRALDGASRAEIVARCGEQGGHWTDLLELEETDEPPVLADGYGWVASNHAVTLAMRNWRWSHGASTAGAQRFTRQRPIWVRKTITYWRGSCPCRIKR